MQAVDPSPNVSTTPYHRSGMQYTNGRHTGRSPSGKTQSSNHRIDTCFHTGKRSLNANDHANSCSATVLLLFCCCLLLLLCCCPKKKNPNTNTLSHLQLRVRVLYSFNDSVSTPSWQLAVGGQLLHTSMQAGQKTTTTNHGRHVQ